MLDHLSTQLSWLVLRSTSHDELLVALRPVALELAALPVLDQCQAQTASPINQRGLINNMSRRPVSRLKG